MPDTHSPESAAVTPEEVARKRQREVVSLLLDYEIRGAWWPHYISNPTLQRWAAIYFRRKVLRKMRNMGESHRMKERVEAAKAELKAMESEG